MSGALVTRADRIPRKRRGMKGEQHDHGRSSERRRSQPAARRRDHPQRNQHIKRAYPTKPGSPVSAPGHHRRCSNRAMPPSTEAPARISTTAVHGTAC
jgi:hypothetical protein